MNNKKSLIKFMIYILLSVALVFLDQFTKKLAYVNLKDQKPFELIKNVFVLQYLENTGAAWGIFSGKITLFAVFTVLVIMIILFILVKSEIVFDSFNSKNSILTLQIVLVTLISGAIGNLIDRLINGYVVDFIYFKLINFPIFNVADCYVTIATAILFILLLFGISEDDWNLILSFKIKESKDFDNE